MANAPFEFICYLFFPRGSLRSPFSKRDPEYNLLYGALNFLYITDDAYHRFVKYGSLSG